MAYQVHSLLILPPSSLSSYHVLYSVVFASSRHKLYPSNLITHLVEQRTTYTVQTYSLTLSCKYIHIYIYPHTIFASFCPSPHTRIHLSLGYSNLLLLLNSMVLERERLLPVRFPRFSSCHSTSSLYINRWRPETEGRPRDGVWWWGRTDIALCVVSTAP